MYVLCPNCLTVFRVHAAELNAGDLHCTRCGDGFPPAGHLFDGVLDAQAARLARERAGIEHTPEPIVAEAGEPAPSPVEDRDLQAPPESHEVPVPEVAAMVPAEPVGSDWDAFGHPPLEREAPELPEQAQEELSERVRREIEAALRMELDETARPALSPRTWLGLAAAVLLVLVLGGQALYFHRAQWLDDPQWRPWAGNLCNLVGCRLPLRKDLGLIELVEREVRDHPQVKDAVLISATFANQADFPQPYPVFEVGFSDLSGTLVAMRRFDPEEYLEEGVDVERGMRPRQPVHVRLEIMDPGRRAVSFKFDFL